MSLRRSLLSLASALALALPLTSTNASAAVDFFLKIEAATPIEGDATAPGRDGEIEILSWSWGASNASIGGGPKGSGRTKFTPVKVLKRIDKSSPLLFRACVVGQTLTRVTLDSVQTDDTGRTPSKSLVKITLENCTISSINSSGATDEDPRLTVTETLELNFTKITWTTTDAAGNVVSTSWDLAQAKK